MGLAGLGLSARAAATVFPGVVRAPAYFTELWVVLGSAAFILLLAAFLAKLARYPAAVKEEFTNPATLGFCGALPVGMTLVAGGIAPYSALTGNFLWEAGCALLLAFQIWALVRWLSGGIELAKLNAGWLIILVGGIVVPGPGIALGHVEASDDRDVPQQMPDQLGPRAADQAIGPGDLLVVGASASGLASRGDRLEGEERRRPHTFALEVAERRPGMLEALDDDPLEPVAQHCFHRGFQARWNVEKVGDGADHARHGGGRLR